MRPIDLIPPEERRGDRAPLRRGALVYFVVGAFAAVLVAVTALVLLSNQVSSKEAEVANLQREDAAAAAKAERLSAYTAFRTMSERRVATVASLADSRFDWERVMRELALILPADVWLVDLTATATPGVTIEGGGGGGGGSLRAAANGPALELDGCAVSQSAVAGFITALNDVDGVTRVAVESSELPSKKNGAGVSSGGDSAGGAANGDCRTRAFITKFQIVVAFDAAPVPVTSGVEESTASEGEEATPSSEEDGEGE